MKSTTYGRKGGEGPTRGKRAATYEAGAPDGSILRCRMFVAGEPPADAIMNAYKHSSGTWYAAAVVPVDAVPDWMANRLQLAARRIK